MAPVITAQKINAEERTIDIFLVQPNEENAKIVEAINIIAPRNTVLLFGGANNLETGQVQAIGRAFRDGLIPGAVAGNAVIIDGGTRVGIMEIVGAINAEQGHQLPLIGVAPERLVSYGDKQGDGLVPLDVNHSCFVLVSGVKKWGAETSTIFALAAGLAGSGKGEQKCSVIALVAGGGEITGEELIKAVDNQIPIIILAGSGGLADKIYAAKQAATPPVADSLEAKILTRGELFFYPVDGDPENIKTEIVRQLGKDEVLRSAWENFANFDHNANIQQIRHKDFQRWILRLGIIIGFMGILWSVCFPSKTDYKDYGCVQWVFYGLIVIAPITLTVLIAAANKFKNGMKWIFFRSGAEDMKREIYSYRARIGPYQIAPAALLSERISEIYQKAMKTDVSHTHISQYDKTKGFPPYMTDGEKGDDGFSRLSAEKYIEYRLKNQENYYIGKTKTINFNLSLHNWLVYIFTGAGTLLAVIKLQVWVALSTALVAAIGNWLGQQQWDNTLNKYNQVAADLNSINGWWQGLSDTNKLLAENRDKLVTRTEQALKNEYDGWAQQMQQTLEELIKRQDSDKQKK